MLFYHLNISVKFAPAFWITNLCRDPGWSFLVGFHSQDSNGDLALNQNPKNALNSIIFTSF